MRNYVLQLTDTPNQRAFSVPHGQPPTPGNSPDLLLYTHGAHRHPGAAQPCQHSGPQLSADHQRTPHSLHTTSATEQKGLKAPGMGAGLQQLTQISGPKQSSRHALRLATCSHHLSSLSQQTALPQSAVQTTALISTHLPSPSPIPAPLLFKGPFLFRPRTVYTPAVFIAADPAFSAPPFQAKKSQAPPASSYQTCLPPPGPPRPPP